MKISKTIFSAILMSFILPVLSPAPNLPGEPIGMLISGPTYVSVSSQTWRYTAMPYVTDGIYEWYVYHTENLLGQGGGGPMDYFDARFLDGGAGEYSVQCELYDSFGLLASGATTVTAVTLDLDVDSNYDGSINGTDESLETSAGGVVPLGGRKPIRITTQGNLGTVSLSAVAGGEKISVWSAAENGTPISLGQSLQVGTTYTFYVQGISASSEVRDIELRLRNTYGTVNIDDNITLTVVNATVDLTAYRPTTELPAYGNPFQRTAVPDDEEESPGAGIRVNGDSESGANENDLIEVQLDVAPFPIPSGLTYVLKRNNPNIKVWDGQTMGTALLDSGTEAAITIGSSPMSVWVENPSGGNADLDLVARSGSTDVCSDKIHFYDFTSIVIALGGLNQVPADPADANHGIFQLAIDLYEDGYDVHMYDEDNVTLDGQGVPYNEVVSAIQDRGVSRVVIYGYSRGGGATYDMSDELDENSTGIGNFTLSLTAYIDAVTSLSAAQENRRPSGSALHINYFQEGVLWPLNDPFHDDGLDGGPIENPAPGDPAGVNVDAGGQTITHYAIDEHLPALNAVKNGVHSLPR